MRNQLILQILYLAASVLFILGLKALSSPKTARRGMNYAAIGMLLAVVGTLFHHEIISYQWIVAGFIIGSLVGGAMAIFMPMTAMPQRIALSHSFGAMAAVLVGVVEYIKVHYQGMGEPFTHGTMGAMGFEVLFGSLTITGSLMAFGKLQGIVPGPPITYKFQNVSNITMFFLTVALFIYLVYNPVASAVFFIMIVLGLIIGVLMVLPIGGADMPVVISLLNSYAGLAASATGFVIENKVLVIAGALDGASGFFLSILMSRAMNRSFANVLFGAVGTVSADTHAAVEAKTVIRYTPEDAALMLENAQSVIVVPGYGMAVAQAQHTVQEAAELLMGRGINVRYAIHPVAGRMPGHMNVLLAEAMVPYDLLLEMDQINNDFPNTDVVLVVGANDVVNPAARYKKDSPLYGMPILEADKARSIIILKRSLKPGFAGEDNELFYDPKTMMVFGDAKATLTKLVQLLKK
jgi:H+-translocating NAD(P) transhydrogenase subunit beta